jgi:hypothetical protein
MARSLARGDSRVIARTAKPSTLKTYRTHVNYALGC